MQSIILFGVSILFGILFIYPYVIYPFFLRLMTPKAQQQRLKMDWNEFPPTDIVLCAYNEEACIASKIENCLSIAQKYGNISIHVYSDGSSDGTPLILKSYADRIDAVISTERSGKSVGMQKLLARCNGDFTVFTDANVMLDEDRFGNFLNYFSDPKTGCVSGNLQYTNKDEGDVASVGAGYWSFEEKLKLLESRTGSTVGADGSLFAIRTKLFSPPPTDIIDDMFTSLSILCDGFRVVQADDWTAYERAATSSGEEMGRKIRIACRCFNCHRLLWPRLAKLGNLDLFKYISHKLVRWLGGFWFLGGLLTWSLFCFFTGMNWLAYASWVALIFLLVAGSFDVPVLRQLREMLISVLAASMGVVQSLRGKRYQTWKIASSTRSPSENDQPPESGS